VYDVGETNEAFGPTVYLPRVPKDGVEITAENGRLRVVGRLALAGRAGTGFAVPVSAQQKPASDPVLLYDGECGLCNRVVRLMLRVDRKGRLRFSPLQGPSGQAYLKAVGLPTEDFSTIVFVPDWAQRDRPEFQLRTEGIVAALRACGGWGTLIGGMVALAPSRWSDRCYDLISRLRFRIFGPWRACPLPKAEWAKRFID